MALLQISEPGMSGSPHQHRLAVGIDLGTTHSLIATVRSGQAQVLSDEQGEYLLPSVVYYQTEGITVGSDALTHARQDPSNVVSSVKRMLGHSLTELHQRYPHLPYHFLSSENGTPFLQTAAGVISPVQVSAHILQALVQRAELAMQDSLSGVVITVPAYFDDAQRQSTKDAAKLAGLPVLRLLNEPTAAAIAYGLDNEQAGNIAVYDLGGGTFDISLLCLNRGVFEVLSTGGDAALGGDDFDEVLAHWLAEKSGYTKKLSKSQWRQLLNTAIKAKIELTSQDSVTAVVEHANTEVVITRSQFEQLITPLVKKTLLACRRALKDADMQPTDITEIIMVGGSSRIPLVRQVVEDFFGKKPLTSIDPDKVVALGAAIQADILVGNKPDTDMLLLDVLPLSLGIETMGGLVEKIIPRNTTIPVAKAQDFTTFKEGQTAMMLHIVQGERELVGDCRSLAKFSLQGLPALAAGAAHIRVTFQVDHDGLLNVTAVEKSTGVTASIDVKPSYGLSEQEMAAMLTDSLNYAHHDIQLRKLVEQKVDAARLIEAITQALQEDCQLLSSQELNEIEGVMTRLQKEIEGDDPDVIEQSVQQLNTVTKEFAARRMNASIRSALTGHSVDEI